MYAMNNNPAHTLSDDELIAARMMLQLCEDFVHCHEDEIIGESEDRKDPANRVEE
jgi:hypothetical protein